MNKSLVLGSFFAVIALVVLSGVISAQGNSNKSNEPVNNMTYGQCVVASVEVKNSCYESARSARSSCISAAAEDSAKVKVCKNDYKKALNQCKTDFKMAKKQCIQTTKPGMFARMRYAFS